MMDMPSTIRDLATQAATRRPLPQLHVGCPISRRRGLRRRPNWRFISGDSRMWSSSLPRARRWTRIRAPGCKFSAIQGAPLPWGRAS